MTPTDYTEYRKWTTAELRALPNMSFVEDMRGRKYQCKDFSHYNRRYWRRSEFYAQHEDLSSAQLARRKLRRIA